MQLEKKYNICFMDLINIPIKKKILLKLLLLDSIFVIELKYYRSVWIINKLIVYILSFLLLMLGGDWLTDILILQIIGINIVLNFDILKVLLHPKLPVISLTDDGNKIELRVLLNKDHELVGFKGAYRNKEIFTINNVKIEPNMTIMLINDYIEHDGNLPQYKLKFLRDNIDITFDDKLVTLNNL